MQTIKVNVKIPSPLFMKFMVDGVCVAHVGPEWHNAGRYAGRINQTGGAACNNKTFADAVEFIGDALCSLFASLGLNVEFINA